MPLATIWAKQFLSDAYLIVSGSPREESTWLSFSTVEYMVENDFAQQLPNYDAELHSLPRRPFGEETIATHKKLNAAFVKNFGYDRYLELDVNPLADIQHDMNVPVPDDWAEQYDLIWDNGSTEHVMNYFMCLENLLKMTKVGGTIIHSQGVGDMMDHGYVTFSPVLFKEFYEANGCHIQKICFLAPSGKTITYDHTWGGFRFDRYLEQMAQTKEDLADVTYSVYVIARKMANVDQISTSMQQCYR